MSSGSIFAQSGSTSDRSDSETLYRHCANPEEADWVWVNKNALMNAAGCTSIKLDVQVGEHLLTFEGDLESAECPLPLEEDRQP